MFDVFLNHSSHNKKWVRVLAKNLQQYGYRVFLDDWVLTPGEKQ